MRILAINTATRFIGVAIVEDEVLLGEYALNTELNYSTRLLPLIDRILKDLELHLEKIDAYALALGPGSFTGLRIGLSTFKTLAWVEKKPLVGINTLEAMAWYIPSYTNHNICPMLDARKTEVYTALFNYHQKKILRLMPDKVIKVEDILSEIKKNYSLFW
ncbi:MAG: tRNA (adenosine(37)-N6)-threonylcarbamoyltransferase complex dimerization subunit type 1 TsaB [bacterium]